MKFLKSLFMEEITVADVEAADNKETSKCKIKSTVNGSELIESCDELYPVDGGMEQDAVEDQVDLNSTNGDDTEYSDDQHIMESDDEDYRSPKKKVKQEFIDGK